LVVLRSASQKSRYGVSEALPPTGRCGRDLFGDQAVTLDPHVHRFGIVAPEIGVSHDEAPSKQSSKGRFPGVGLTMGLGIGGFN
jgi:hypothetical protein